MRNNLCFAVTYVAQTVFAIAWGGPRPEEAAVGCYRAAK